MKMKRFGTLELPAYLADALAPLEWSAVFSQAFKDMIIVHILSQNRDETVDGLCEAINTLGFLDSSFKFEVARALRRFADEGWPKKKAP